MVSPAYIANYQSFSSIQASYAALAVQTREFLVIVMWAGQVFGELLNWVIKRAIKQERPIRAAFTTISGFHSEEFFSQNTLGMDTAFLRLTANTWHILHLS
jgi:hypothetical protein